VPLCVPAEPVHHSPGRFRVVRAVHSPGVLNGDDSPGTAAPRTRNLSVALRRFLHRLDQGRGTSSGKGGIVDGRAHAASSMVSGDSAGSWVVRVTASRYDPNMVDSYAVCWESLKAAARLRAEFAAAWGRFLDDEPYEFDLITERDGTGAISVRVNWRDDVVAELSGIVAGLAAALRSSLDNAVRVTVRLLTGQRAADQSPALHFPICTDEDEFESRIEASALRGLRPDQVRLVRSLQPFVDVDASRPGLQVMHDSLLFLRNLAAAGNAVRVLSWAYSAAPELEVAPPASVEHLAAEPDGYVELQAVVARFRLRGYQPGTGGRAAVRGTPNVAIDAAAHVDPPPAHGDDILSRRTGQLLAVVSEVVRSFERSMGLRRDMPPPPRSSSDPRLDSRPPTSPWRPQAASPLAMTADELEQLRASPLGSGHGRRRRRHDPAGGDARRRVRAHDPPALPLRVSRTVKGVRCVGR
jgi:hypothetical protein